MGADADQHEWFSWTDPQEGATYLFDITFLASSWSCIFGDGCLGVHDQPTPERGEGCCSFGAHFADGPDRKRVERAIARLTPQHWQRFAVAAALDGPIWRDDNGDWTTRTHDDACIMLNRPGFAGGEGCALHVGAVAAGERPLDWKPEVCWQLPLRLEHSEDTLGHDTFTLREWKRRDWGDGGAAFHWWCTDDALAFVGKSPVWQSSRDEIIELVGEVPYEALVEYLTGRSSATMLPHPAVRRGSTATKTSNPQTGG